MPIRVTSSLRHLALVVADEPEIGAACTAALLDGGADPAVRAVRDRIGAEIHRRITSAIGPGADPGTVFALEMAFFERSYRPAAAPSPTTRSPIDSGTWWA